jgi:ribonucleoside-diphosphate reductase alpha chain
MDEFADTFPEAHKQGFAEKIKMGVDAGRLEPRMLEYDLLRLGAELRPERDTLFTYLGAQVLYDRYFLKGNRDHETPSTSGCASRWAWR